MRKKLTAGFLGFLMLVMTVFTCFVPVIETQAAGKTLIVHYGGRSDNNYEGWNLWLWEEGREGQQVSFTETDSFGQIAVYQTNRTPANIGFIVRLNEWEAKDIAEDRFVAMDADVVEIWITSEEEIQKDKAVCTDPVESKYMEDGWMKLVGTERNEDCETYLLEDAESYCTCFVIKLDKDWIDKEMLEEWEK